ncbi:MAG: response regulator transcription factor [Anaerolineales bacterium]|nr:response regulator transcription factor [Anaerolineales bacterium]MCB8960950.1 response regulator transcription factor [Ardenticatenales bacterium]
MIRIILAHSSHLLCDSLRTVLDNHESAHVVGCASSVEELYYLLPMGDVVLLGSELRGVSALQILDELRQREQQTKVLILGLRHDPDLVISYIEKGAAGYVLQAESVEDIIAKIQAADQAQALVSPTVAAAMMERLSLLANLEKPLAFTASRQTLLDQLTRREEEVLQLISAGESNKRIAQQLYIECGTVKNHVHNILKKLEVNSRQDAASIYTMHEHGSPAMAF